MENEKTRILLCEDDENLGMLLREYLEVKGYIVDLCINGEEGYDSFQQERYDLCILDVMMPKMDGFTLAEKIHDIDPAIPFMFLTAKTLKDDVKLGFELGADDYITKPFSMEEVVLRIEAVMRRVRGKSAKVAMIYQLGNFIFDTQKQTLAIGDDVEKLTTKETDLLRLLASRVNELVQREYALKVVWVEDNYYNARSMDVYITKLRKRLKKDPALEILNVHGKGYKLILPDTSTFAILK